LVIGGVHKKGDFVDGFFDDPATQQALNERWWATYRRKPDMAEQIGFTRQSPEVVQRVLDEARASRNGTDGPDVTGKLTVVEAAPVGLTKAGQPTTTRNISTVARLLLTQGYNNEEVTAKLTAQGFTVKRNYAAWYRAELTRQGVLTGDLATSQTRRGTMAAPMARPVSMSFEEQVMARLTQMTTVIDQVATLKKTQSGLKMAHQTFCKELGLKTQDDQMQSPVLRELERVTADIARMEEQHGANAKERKALEAALKAYKQAKAEQEKPAPAPTRPKAVTKVVRPQQRKAEPPAPPAPDAAPATVA
jgi:hypothetical protein